MMTNLKSIIKKKPHGFVLCASLAVFALAALTLTSCINEEVAPCQSAQELVEGNDYYIKLDIRPLGNVESRSTTIGNNGGSSDGTQNGLGNENKVSNVSLYFFDVTGNTSSTNGKLLYTFNTLEGIEELTPTTQNRSSSYSITKKIEVSDIKKILGKKTHIYVLANLDTYPDAETTDEENTTKGTEESEFLEETFSVSTLGTGFSLDFKDGGMLCPMANYEKFELDLLEYTYSSDEDAYNKILSLFNQNYTGTGYKAGDRLYVIPKALDLERMIARIDYKDGSNTDYDNTYELPHHTANVDDCNIAGGGVYLKLNRIALFNAGSAAYDFRHTAEGTYKEAGTTVKPFGFESAYSSTGTTAESPYTWISSYSSNTLTPTLSQLYNVDTREFNPLTDGIVSADKVKGTSTTYSPCFYVMENTVSKTSEMDLQHCTGLLLEVVLCKKDGDIYTGDGLKEVRITKDDGYYRVLSFMESTASSEVSGDTGDNSGESSEEGTADGANTKTGYYYLIYKYLIPHNIAYTNTGTHVDPSDGNEVDTEGTATTLIPMQYGIVRNNIYQLSLKGINNLPDLHEPDALTLTIDVKIWPWDVRYDDDITLF
ncbi:MAG: fimbria major subunit [Muribaculaceae bacterium]|nr:fimbria major subunit [Muribaculaceae bacterium]